MWTMTPIRDPKFDYCSIWDDLPKGWLKAFGTMMCDELEEEFEKYNAQNKLYVEQAKEKYGGMRLYMPTVGNAQAIVDKYEKISENICCRCGRPHVPCLNLSWISPYCKDCFEKLQKKNEYFYQGEYEKYTPENKEHWKIPEKIRWRKYSKEEGERIEEIDISDTVRKIERRWDELHPDRKQEWCT